MILICKYIFLQLEQEMDLILKRSNGYYQFQSEWREKWSPAILQYMKKSKKKTTAAQIYSGMSIALSMCDIG